MQDAVVQFLRSRAHDRCEYCLIFQDADELPFQVEHVIARKHGGDDGMENLALACAACNNHKGANIAGLDPETGLLTRLFHPRRDRWTDHFTWRGAELLGRTAVGRTTIAVLSINLQYRVALREALLEEGRSLSPPV